MKQFSELTAEERADLQRSLDERAVREGRDLLKDVVCSWPPPEKKEKTCANCFGKFVPLWNPPYDGCCEVCMYDD
jgi:hypothetical protein